MAMAHLRMSESEIGTDARRDPNFRPTRARMSSLIQLSGISRRYCILLLRGWPEVLVDPRSSVPPRRHRPVPCSTPIDRRATVYHRFRTRQDPATRQLLSIGSLGARSCPISYSPVSSRRPVSRGFMRMARSADSAHARPPRWRLSSWGLQGSSGNR